MSEGKEVQSHRTNRETASLEPAFLTKPQNPPKPKRET